MTARVHTALVAPEGEIEPTLRAARATVARLSLRLRSVMHEAEQLEQSADHPSEATAVLASSLRQMVEARRHDLARELDAERDRAALVLESARREAAAMRLRTDESDDSTAPEAVWGAPAPESQRAGDVALDPDGGAEDASAERSVSMPEEPPALAASDGRPHAPAEVAVPVAVAAAAAFASADSPSLDAAVAVGAADVASDRASIPAPHPVVERSSPELPTAGDGMLHLSDAAAISRTGLLAPPAPAASNPAPASASVLVDVQALSSVVAAAVATAMAQARPIGRTEPRPVEVAPRRSFGARVMHLDVLLPLLAAVIVLVVLLAWIA